MLRDSRCGGLVQGLLLQTQIPVLSGVEHHADNESFTADHKLWLVANYVREAPLDAQLLLSEEV